jgi:DNA-binding response OmpR family regulator
MPHVLVVEDDDAIRSLVRAVLEDAGCTSEGATNGASALELRGRAQFDVGVVDLRMPVMGGVEFYLELRRLGDSLPVILLSGERDLVATARRLGVGWLKKPFDPDELVHRVLKAARRQESSQPGPGAT